MGMMSSLIQIAHLVDKPRKIMWNILFDISFNFSTALTLIGLILLFMLILVFTHSHAFEPHAAVFDKLLRALTASDLNKLGLNI